MTDENNNIADSVSVTLDNEQNEQNENKDLRAFFVSFASSKEEAEAIQEGRASASGFVPLYAENEQTAWAFLNDQIKNGLIVTGFEPLEVLEMKVFMLRNIAGKHDINLQRQKMFDGRLLLVDHPPVRIYAQKDEGQNTQEQVVDAVVNDNQATETGKSQDNSAV